MKSLRRHQKLHSNEFKVHQCHICKVEYLSKSNLKEHLQTHETLRKEFKCEKCPKVFMPRELSPDI